MPRHRPDTGDHQQQHGADGRESAATGTDAILDARRLRRVDDLEGVVRARVRQHAAIQLGLDQRIQRSADGHAFHRRRLGAEILQRIVGALDRESARGEIKTLQHTLEKAQKFDVWVLVTLDGVTEDTRPKLSDIVSNYSVFGERDPISAAVTYGVAANQLRILLTDVDRKTVVQRLVIDEPGRRRWAYDSFVPMEPTFVLKKER